MPWRELRWALAALLAFGLMACHGGENHSPLNNMLQLKLQGIVHAGTLVLSGASVKVYASDPLANGPLPLGQALSDATGAFQLSIACPSDGENPLQTYVVISGGQAAGNAQGSNTAIELVAMLGTCANIPGAINVSELTTIAAAYALNAFVNGDVISGGAPGLPNAIATATLLADPGSGALGASLPSAHACAATAPPLNCEAVTKMNALANALAACTTASASTASPCVALMACSTANAIDNGDGSCAPADAAALPTTIWQAILSIARNPGLVSASGLSGITATSNAYSPATATAPNDWALSLTYNGGGLSEPTALAIDGSGNVWLANYNNAVSEFSPTGTALSPAGGFTGGGLEESFALAIDTAGHVWVCNEQSSAAVNSGLGTLTELAPDGTALSGANGITGGGLDFPVAIVPDAAGHVWVTNFGNSTLSEFAGDGTALSPAAGFTGGGLSFPVGLSIDAAGNVWVADQGANQISAFSSTGAALSPASGFTGGGLDVPQGIAADANGHVWVSNYYSASISEFNNRGVPLSPPGGYVAGGLATPGGIAIDAAGNVWVANYDTASVSELAGAQSNLTGAARSPDTGFRAEALLQPFAVAIDPSGNLWVSNFGNNTVTEFIGIAAPVATPLIGVPHAP
jgi:sugar lactone lactonase YvrE